MNVYMCIYVPREPRTLKRSGSMLKPRVLNMRIGRHRVRAPDPGSRSSEAVALCLLRLWGHALTFIMIKLVIDVLVTEYVR